jgi:hypothetical protein
MTSDYVKKQLEAHPNPHQQPIDPALAAALQRLAEKIDSLEKQLIRVNSSRSIHPVRSQNSRRPLL